MRGVVDIADEEPEIERQGIYDKESEYNLFKVHNVRTPGCDFQSSIALKHIYPTWAKIRHNDIVISQVQPACQLTCS